MIEDLDCAQPLQGAPGVNMFAKAEPDPSTSTLAAISLPIILSFIIFPSLFDFSAGQFSTYSIGLVDRNCYHAEFGSA